MAHSETDRRRREDARTHTHIHTHTHTHTQMAALTWETRQRWAEATHTRTRETKWKRGGKTAWSSLSSAVHVVCTTCSYWETSLLRRAERFSPLLRPQRTRSCACSALACASACACNAPSGDGRSTKGYTVWAVGLRGRSLSLSSLSLSLSPLRRPFVPRAHFSLLAALSERPYWGAWRRRGGR